ncbi:hypothetical protein [Clostridium paraputrificum]|uniref:Uncharacterized protein n=1 Tax=Clostridium paraputrificum TaxID=29363 RepID=A0A6N3EVF0_9CLOT
MNSTTLRQVLGILSNSSKARYRVYAESDSISYEFAINCKDGSDGISVTTTYKNIGTDSNAVYKKAEDVPLESCKLTELIEIKTTRNGLINSEEKLIIYRETELFIKVLRVLRENAVFIIKNNEETRVCYYINSRVYYVHRTNEVYELVETNMFVLYSTMPRAHIVAISALPKHYTLSAFFLKQRNIAYNLGLTYVDNKNGVGV